MGGSDARDEYSLPATWLLQLGGYRTERCARI